MEAATTKDVGGLARDGKELFRQPGLPDPCGAEQREHVADPLRDDVLERSAKALLLTDPPDERRIEMPREGSSGRVHGHEPKGGHRLALPFQLERFDRLHRHGVPHERERLGADQDLARRGRLFEPGCHVDRIARYERLALAGHDLARVDARPERQRYRQLLAERRQPIADLGYRSHCPQRVVLVSDRDAEHRHHRVADELLHRAAVPFHDQPDLLEVPAHRAPHRLGVEPFPERGRARTSQKTTVTVFRISRAAATGASAAPHAPQKRNPSWLSSPQA